MAETQSVSETVVALNVKVENLISTSSEINKKLDSISVQLGMVPIHAVRLDHLETRTDNLDTRVTDLSKSIDQARGSARVLAYLLAAASSVITGVLVYSITTHLK